MALHELNRSRLGATEDRQRTHTTCLGHHSSATSTVHDATNCHRICMHFCQNYIVNDTVLYMIQYVIWFTVYVSVWLTCCLWFFMSALYHGCSWPVKIWFEHGTLLLPRPILMFTQMFPELRRNILDAWLNYKVAYKDMIHCCWMFETYNLACNIHILYKPS